MVPRAHSSPYSKRHLDRFGRFCRAHGRDRPTDRQTHHATPSVAIGYCDAPNNKRLWWLWAVAASACTLTRSQSRTAFVNINRVNSDRSDVGSDIINTAGRFVYVVHDGVRHNNSCSRFQVSSPLCKQLSLRAATYGGESSANVLSHLPDRIIGTPCPRRCRNILIQQHLNDTLRHRHFFIWTSL